VEDLLKRVKNLAFAEAFAKCDYDFANKTCQSQPKRCTENLHIFVTYVKGYLNFADAIEQDNPVWDGE
jgi:hypothetical protein